MQKASSFPLSAMDSRKTPKASSSSPSSSPQPFPHFISSISGFIQLSLSRFREQWMQCEAEACCRIEEGKRRIGSMVGNLPIGRRPVRPFAAISHEQFQPKRAFDIALSTEEVAKTLAGTAVYTVSNANNEFVLVSDPNGQRSLGLLCFRQEDAESLLAQVQLRQPVLGKGARVVPITLDQVYMLKVEGIAFRFLPDPTQIRNALELKASGATKAFDGVPVFQSDLLVVKKKNRRYCPIYFQKEDIERELLKVSRVSRGVSLSQHIMVGSLEDVLKKMEINSKNSGWEDLIFIPPGKSYSQHIKVEA
ncbi:protein TIC 22, chloroplastic [Nymphaea colorata]|nr:protein TIC 22, chloroplastic [Nymphaea colorata]